MTNENGDLTLKRYVGVGNWRDEFAIAVLQGIYAGNPIGDTGLSRQLKQTDYEKTAKVCYEQADAMLKERGCWCDKRE